MSTCIYTASFGGYDPLPPLPAGLGVDCIAFTDDPDIEPNGWHVWPTVPPPGPPVHPRQMAKLPKLFPHFFVAAYDQSIWIDASHEILTCNFVGHCLAAIGDSGMALYEHPWRDCIYQEAEASIVLEKYASLPITAQVDSYRSEYPEHGGLYATGTLARRHTPAVDALMAAWAAEIDQWTYQDQLSLPVVCGRLGFTPETFPCHQVFNNQWTAIHPHRRED